MHGDYNDRGPERNQGEDTKNCGFSPPIGAFIVPVLAIVAAVVVFTFTKAKDYPEGAHLLEEKTL